MEQSLNRVGFCKLSKQIPPFLNQIEQSALSCPAEGELALSVHFGENVSKFFTSHGCRKRLVQKPDKTRKARANW